MKCVAAAAQGKASAFFKGPLKSFTIIGMEVKASSMTFDGVCLCVPLPWSVCRHLWPAEAEMMCVCVCLSDSLFHSLTLYLFLLSSSHTHTHTHTHSEPFLAVGIFGTGGTLKVSLPDIPLKGGDNKVHMRSLSLSLSCGLSLSLPLCPCRCVSVCC